LEEYTSNENRYTVLKRSNPERAAALSKKAQHQTDEQYKFYKYLADRKCDENGDKEVV